MKLYHKGKKLGRVIRIQFFNNMLVIAYLDKNGKIKDMPNSEELTIGRPKKLRNAIQKRISTYRSRFYKIR